MPHLLFQAALRTLTRAVMGGAIGVVLAAIPVSYAEPAKPGAEIFFSNPVFTDAQLSPDGKFVAMLVSNRDGRMKLAVMDLADRSFKGIAGDVDMDITDIHWVNSERLTFSTSDPQTGQGDVRFWPGLFAVNRDGSEMKTLSSITWGGRTFYDVDRTDNSDDIFVTYSNGRNLIRLNTKTGRGKTFDRPGDTVRWIVDQNGIPRINETQHNGVSEIFYRDPATDTWRKIAEFNAYKGAFAPAFFGPDGTFYVLARKGRDTQALYRYDLEKNAIDPNPVIAINGYDFDGLDRQLVFDRASKKLLGVHYQTDAAATLWFDDGMKKIQKAVDDLLPATINTLSIGRGGQTKNVLVEAYSDVQPAVYLLYDTTTGKLVTLGNSHPDVNPKQMAQQDMVHYPARDGLSIPAYLTLPRDSAKKNLPMVVLVHGGPYLRINSWGWNDEVQFLASRGYAVLQPEFRGSPGFGNKLFQAGWKQWGLAMQDDIDDGARWAIAQGIADPKRVCIAGASYGGYATLMGLAKDPDLFRCGIDWAGVTDLNLLLSWDWSSDMSEEWRQFGSAMWIGDPVKDAAQLKATSPVNVADRIKQPLLLAYGGSDYRVPIAHGEKFRDAVRPYNDKVEWIEYPEEGHGWFLLKNRVDFWTRVDKFLKTNIGNP